MVYFAYRKYNSHNHLNSRSVRVLESFEKLWKLKMQFSKTWKVLEKKGYFKMAMEKFWIFVWKNSNHILKWM